MNLLIVESSGKIKKIRSILKDGWNVAASIGHVRDLPKSSLGVYPPRFEPLYVETERGESVLEELRRKVRDADEVFLATDPDREGEAIAWHLADCLGLKNPKRVTYTEITEPAVIRAVKAPRPIDMSLVRAQEGRRVLDRLFGYSVSPALKAVTGENLSAGRVQSPALRLVVEREAAIRAFNPVSYFSVDLHFNGKKGSKGSWRASLNPKSFLPEDEPYFADRELAKRLSELRELKVVSYRESEYKKAPPPPFITSTLQQAASVSLKLNPEEAMAVAQRLYEAGHITYMRTDSPQMSEEAVREIRSLAESKGWPVPDSPRAYSAKSGAQEAHECVRPTRCSLEAAGESKKEEELYKMIRLRAIASQLSDAIYDVASAVLEGTLDDKKYLFDARGRTLAAPGWRSLTPSDPLEEKGEERDPDMKNPVPKLSEGQKVSPTEGELRSKKTVPPPRYTQASLIRELEKKGIGRPSTYASIMGNIEGRAYVAQNQKRQLLATPAGESLIGELAGNFGFLEYNFTRDLEIKLDLIAEGKAEYLGVVSEANGLLENELASYLGSRGVKTIKCPACGGPLQNVRGSRSAGGTRRARSWNFWKCQNPGCSSIYNDREGLPDFSSRTISQLTEIPCPVCAGPLRHLVREEGGGRRGFNYWKCSKEDCMTQYDDAGDRPDFSSPRGQADSSSDYLCPACDSELRHIQRDPSDGDKGYNYWKCASDSCGSFYDDAGDKPDFSTRRQSVLTDFSCPGCGSPLKHITKDNDSDGKGGYNYWSCSNRDCRKYLWDKDGSPDYESQAGRAGDSGKTCPACGAALSHLYREAGSDGSGGYNYWKCQDKECGSLYDDASGEPDPATLRRSILTAEACPNCASNLRRNIRLPDLEGKNGYDYWSCVNKVCRSTFNDKAGKPDFENPRTFQGGYGGESEKSCPACGKPLRHLAREAGPDSRGYNYWRCSDNALCGAAFEDKDGEPDPATKKRSLITEESCPKCQSPLRHNIKEPDARGLGGYDYWSCSDRECRSFFNDAGGSPDLENPYRRQGPGGTETAVPCPNCGANLRRLKREADGAGKGYDYWRCPDDAKCGAVYDDKDGSPDPATLRRAVTSAELCPVCQSPLRHLVRAEGPLGRAYNFWGCSNRDCRTTLEDLDGSPNFEKMRHEEPSEFECPDCGQPLVHMQRDAGESGEGFNYWKCPREACGSFFDDQGGEPDFSSLRKSVLTDKKCPRCQGRLKHSRRDPSPSSRGYDYWVCSNSSCKASFEDNAGSPGAERKKTSATLSEHKCPECGKPLRHIVKEADGTSQGYNFWGCSGYPECRVTLNDDNGAPGSRNSRKNEPSGFKCPRCSSDLYRRKGVSSKTGNDYDFFSCSNNECRSIFNTKNDEPFIPDAVKKKFEAES